MKCIICKKEISKYAKRCLKCHKISIKGKNNPSYKDGRRIKKHYCVDCKKKIHYQTFLYGNKRCRSCSKKGCLNHRNGVSMSEELKKKISLIKGGTGIPYEKNKYPYQFFKMRVITLKRDNYICQNCNMTQEEHYILYGKDIEVHHINYNKDNNSMDNFITLCHACNLRANYNRKNWREFYGRKLFSYIT